MQKLMNKSHKEKILIIHCDYGKLSFFLGNVTSAIRLWLITWLGLIVFPMLLP